MNKGEQENLNTDWNAIISEGFFDAWQRNSPVDITNYAYKIGNHFNLDLIVKKLQLRLMDSGDKERDIKYHVNRLKVLINVFVLALLRTSDDGKSLTAHNIEKAKHAFQEKEFCDYE